MTDPAPPKKLGRPPAANPRVHVIKVSLTDEEFIRIDDIANRQEVPLAYTIRRLAFAGASTQERREEDARFLLGIANSMRKVKRATGIEVTTMDMGPGFAQKLTDIAMRLQRGAL